MSFLKRATEFEPKDDVFDREGIIHFLTSLLLKVEGPFVFNINSEWGTGKTFFLKLWENVLKTDEYKNKTDSVFFNAWENDYNSESLPAFMATFLSQINIPKEQKKEINNFIGRVLIKGTAALIKGFAEAQFGKGAVSEVYDLVMGEAESLGQKELESIFERKSDLKTFKTTIKTNIDPEMKIFVFIDELDRCNPLFAIDLLEKVKHFFDIDGLIFIIATDTIQLSHSINGVYGENFDSHTYLKRFFDQTYKLPEPDYLSFINVLLNFSTEKCLPFAGVAEDIALVAENFKLSLRDVQQLLIRFNAVVNGVTGINRHCPLILSFLIVARTHVKEDLFKKKLDYEDIKQLIAEDSITRFQLSLKVGRYNRTEIKDFSFSHYVEFFFYNSSMINKINDTNLLDNALYNRAQSLMIGQSQFEGIYFNRVVKAVNLASDLS